MSLAKGPVLLASALLAAALLAGCGQGDDAPQAAPETTPTAGAPDVSTPDALAEWMRQEHGDEEWPSHIEDIVYTTKLRSFVIELRFRGAAEEADAHADAAFAALHAGDLGLDAWVEAWAEGAQFAGTGLGSPVERDLPEPSDSVEALREWLAQVYGDTGGEAAEPWFEAIEQIELGESAARRPVIRVETSLPLDGERSADRANLIVTAIAQAQPTFADEIEVWYAEEQGLLTGSTAQYNPYVY
jgi:hypothetical protein